VSVFDKNHGPDKDLRFCRPVALFKIHHMSSFQPSALLQSLGSDMNGLLHKLDQLEKLDLKTLNTPPAPGKWSILQVLEHLNSYNRYYLPQIENAVRKGLDQGHKASIKFHPGWFGNYFTRIMLPGKTGQVGNRMSAPKEHRPAQQLDAAKVVTEFRAGSLRLVELLQLATTTDIGRLRVPISISRFIRLKLGDTFHFLIAHQLRHFVQIQNVLNGSNPGGTTIIHLAA
jgi:hypothetical protein